ncbi:hypothetical protein GQ42DRAFT_115081, partial [Ramicandelaber brevisporus]
EFREFLAHTEYSIENLLFYEWVEAYREKWSTLPQPIQDLSPPQGNESRPEADVSKQPFRSEIDECIVQFFSDDGRHQLNLPNWKTKWVLEESQNTTHPSLFDKSMKEVMRMLEQSA